MVNKRDFAAIEAEIKASGCDEEVLQKYTGPGVGLMYDDKAGLKVAEGWAFDVEGNLLNIEQATGPATGMIYDSDKNLVVKG